ncbi:MAG TPA: UPF0175 family protein [Thermoanaerobaculia bacterium]|jgi:predicted HTH domain antitoxin|nr:UPF0175 family protein [Thermoanaerobaculia bacterium]
MRFWPCTRDQISRYGTGGLRDVGFFSVGGAVRLANMERMEFLLALRDYQVSPFQATAEDLKLDIDSA